MSYPIKQILNIRDEAIDIDDIARRIEKNIAQRRERSGALSQNFDAISQGLPDLPRGQVVSAATYYNLLRLQLTQDLIIASPDDLPVSIPIFGRLWRKIRQQFHQLVLYYVNRSAARQAVFNYHVHITLRGLIDDVEAYVRSTDDDHAPALTDISERLTHLEQQMPGNS